MSFPTLVFHRPVLVQLCVVHYADLLVMPTWPALPLVAAA
jgi:hypothetical protein